MEKKKFLKKLWLTVIINVLIMITTVYDFIILIIIKNVYLIFFETKKKKLSQLRIALRHEWGIAS